MYVPLFCIRPRVTMIFGLRNVVFIFAYIYIYIYMRDKFTVDYVRSHVGSINSIVNL
jgi:hypothetical protein